jgi:hypothetical protein
LQGRKKRTKTDRIDARHLRDLLVIERLLEAGVANPYFIWPNVDPFRGPSSLAAAVSEPGTASQLTRGDNALAEARTWVRAAREAGAGVFSKDDPLLQAFEVRFLSRQSTIEVDRGEREVRRPPRSAGYRPEQGGRRAAPAPALPHHPLPGGPALRPSRVRAAVRGARLASRN